MGKEGLATRRKAPGDAIGRRVPGAASARKLLSVLLCFTPETPHWSVAELSDTLTVSTSTMYRYIALLREVGLLEPVGENAYRLSDRFVTLARAAQQGRSSLEDVSMPVMTRIRDAINETVLIARRYRDYVYCVERVEARQPVRLQFERGQPMSLHLGSMARVLLANMPRAERDRYIASLKGAFPKRSAAVLTPKKLDAVAKAGFTESFEEVDEGIWGTAAAITVNRRVIASIGVAAPIYRLDDQLRRKIIDAVRAGAAEISQKLEPTAD